MHTWKNRRREYEARETDGHSALDVARLQRGVILLDRDRLDMAVLLRDAVRAHEAYRSRT